MSQTPEPTRTELEAATSGASSSTSGNRSNIQILDLINLGGFCRNCLSDWYREAAEDAWSRDDEERESRELIYGMPYSEWQARHQAEAAVEKLAAFEKNRPQP